MVAKASQRQNQSNQILVSRKQAAEMLGGLSVWTLMYHERQGRLTPVRLSGKARGQVYYDRLELEAFVEAMKAESQKHREQKERKKAEAKRASNGDGKTSKEVWDKHLDGLPTVDGVPVRRPNRRVRKRMDKATS